MCDGDAGIRYVCTCAASNGVEEMTLKLVAVDDLKQDIRSYLATGYMADEKQCEIILGLIDDHTARCTE